MRSLSQLLLLMTDPTEIYKGLYLKIYFSAKLWHIFIDAIAVAILIRPITVVLLNDSIIEECLAFYGIPNIVFKTLLRFSTSLS